MVLYSIEELQLALVRKGFDPGAIDGIMGKDTQDAIVDFKKSIGFKPRPYIGPLTLKKLGVTNLSDNNFQGTISIPWLNEMSKYMGYHEEDLSLKTWLKSDGSTVGDPDDIPWCGDALETCVKNTMPNEIFTGKVKKNPYLAANWLDFGNETTMLYGAIVVLWRGSPESWKGHIAIVIGYDPVRKRIRIRGGNQSDKVCDTWIAENRVRSHGFRVPKTFEGVLPPIPLMNSKGAIISTNEA